MDRIHNHGQLGHLQWELVAPLWSVKSEILVLASLIAFLRDFPGFLFFLDISDIHPGVIQ